MKKKRRTLLSSISAFVMMVLMIPAAAFAQEGNVCQIGDVPYPSLKEAVAAAEDGSIISLTQGSELDSDIIVDEDIILDLNGQVLTTVNIL